MDISKFLFDQALVMVPTLWVVGEFAKYTETLSNKYIPLLVLLVSLAITPAVLGSYTDPQNIVQAILVAGAAVFGDQLVKQLGSDD